MLAEGKDETVLISLEHVPLTHGGRVGFQVENTLASVAAAWGLGGDVSVGGVLGSFAVNFGVNSLTGGAGFFARQSIQIGAGTVYDVARGENFGSSLAFNAAGHIFAGTNGGAFLSTDDGEHWTPINDGLAIRKITVLAVDSR
ncbi:hypothetical protein HC766_09430, partial [Candidatus Gracilibacteria bacterium]|nr:hypothetical protein [Candidatus Gracilibacteria bacterium]